MMMMWRQMLQLRRRKRWYRRQQALTRPTRVVPMAPLTMVLQFWSDNKTFLQVVLCLCDISYGAEALLGLFSVICRSYTFQARSLDLKVSSVGHE